MLDPRFHWNEKTLLGYTKRCWRGFKRDYKAEKDEDLAHRIEQNKRANRWRERRIHVRTLFFLVLDLESLTELLILRK